MFMTSDILFDALSKVFKVRTLGTKLESRSLLRPEFYFQGSSVQADRVYLVRSNDLPRSPEHPCLFICVGGCLSPIQDHWISEVLYISDSHADLMTVFNIVQQTFEKINTWELTLKELLEHEANLEQMLRVSIPIFENRIAIVDYDLRILAYCGTTETSHHKEVKICNTLDRMPDEKSVLFGDAYIQNMILHNPYHVNIDGCPNYCINLFLENKYMGVCALAEDYRPIKECDYSLFQVFAKYIQQAFVKQSQMTGSQFVTLKTIFPELLQCLPVSESSMERALDIHYRNTTLSKNDSICWICIVVQSANRKKNLPEDYLCSSVEHILPGCIPFFYDKQLVIFHIFDSAAATVHSSIKELLPYLNDMNFCAGISHPFYNIYDARIYHLQAQNALKIGTVFEPQKRLYDFSDYVVLYMLQNCCGQFEPEQLLSPGLKKIHDYKGGTDYWETLKLYLDNECNASQTANDMFLHRTSLLPRIRKLKSFVNMDTPMQRLYLRMAIYLYELMQER